MVGGHVLPKRQLKHQLVGTGPVEAHPVILPRFPLVGGIGDHPGGINQKQIPRPKLINCVVYRICAFPVDNIMDQIVIPYAGAPGIAALTALQAPVEDGKFHIVGIILFERLLVCAGHPIHLRRNRVGQKTIPPLIPHMIFNYSKSINKSPFFRDIK